MTVSDTIYLMFIETTITGIPPGVSGYIWLDIKLSKLLGGALDL